MVTAQAKVAILGGDPTTGASLEALLQAEGYRVRFFSEDMMDEVLKTLADYQLLIVAAVPGAGVRKASVNELSCGPLAEVPLLELLPVNGERLFPRGRVLLWPCSPERLKGAIDSILRS